MADPKPITLVAGDNPNPSLDPQPFVVVGGIPGSGDPSVTSVNGQDGEVVLDAADVGALPDDYTPPAPTWGSVTGKPSTFTPATHTHAVADVSGLQAILNDYESRIAALESASGA